MLSPRRLSRVLPAALAALLVVAGCSTLPTAPKTQDSAAAGFAPSATNVEATLIGDPSTTTSEPVSVSSTRVLTPLLGGIVKAGDFTVIVPPLALRKTATITVIQPDRTKPVVELRIGPESANGFLLPVVLVANASRVSTPLLPLTCLSWYNPTTRLWEPVPGSTVSLAGLTVQAPLMHFSTYRVENQGKAGW